MTPEQTIRRAAQHWYDHLRDTDTALDYEGFDDDLETALAGPDGPTVGNGEGTETSPRPRTLDGDQLLEWLDERMKQSVGVWKHFGDSAHPAFEACRMYVESALESP